MHPIDIYGLHKKNTGKKKGIDRGINIFVAHLYISFCWDINYYNNIYIVTKNPKFYVWLSH